MKTDILIIGGSSIGLNCAYYLLKSGRKVTILEANEVAKGNASGNAGQIVPSHIVPLAAPGVASSALKWMLDEKTSPFGMALRLNWEYIKWLIQFARSCNEANLKHGIPAMRNLGQLSAANFESLIESENIECHYGQTGMITLFRDAKTFSTGVREAEILQKYGIDVKVLNKTELHELEPILQDDVIGGTHCTGDCFVNPALFLQSLSERVRAMGAKIFEHTPVTGFETQNGKIIKVKSAEKIFEAEQVILASGVWSPTLARELKLNIPVQPARGYSFTIDSIKQMPKHAFTLGDRHVAVTPFGKLLRVTGRLEVGHFDRTPNPKWIGRLENFLREYFLLEEKINIVETWAGLRPVTPDGIPIIGRSTLHTNLIVATGHAMLGLTLGPATGQLVAGLVNDKTTVLDISAFALERFM